MTPDLRVVFDTNVVVSAMLLPLSVPRQALDRAMREGRPLISAATITELA
jgi:predicted nucleic acid-binding protein